MRKELYIGSDGVCDFCGAEDVVRVYYADNFDMLVAGQAQVRSIGDWFACSECQRLVEENNTDGLALRTVNEHCRLYPEDDNPITRFELTEVIRQVQAAFMQQIKGSDPIDEC